MHIFRKLLIVVFLLFSWVLVAQAKAEESSGSTSSVEQYEDELQQLQSEKKHLYMLLGKEKYTKSNAPKVKVKRAQRAKKSKKYRRRGRHVDIRVDISQQLMRVSKDNRVLYTWHVSTGRRGYETPRGTYRPKFIRRRYHDNACNRAFMPYAVFFDHNLAIYGTHNTRNLGRNVAYSCIKIATDNARILYNLVKSYGKYRVRIRITR